MSTLPATTSMMAAVSPFAYGTWRTLMPAATFSISMARCGVPPTPGDA